MPTPGVRAAEQPARRRSPAASRPCRRSARARSSADRRCGRPGRIRCPSAPPSIRRRTAPARARSSLAPRRDFTRSMKARVDVLLDRLEARDVLGVLGQERIEHRLVGAGRIDAPLDADLLDQLGKAERRADHADRADDRGRVGDDLVGRAGDHVAARGRDVLDEGDDRALLLARRAGGCAGTRDATAPPSRPAN